MDIILNLALANGRYTANKLFGDVMLPSILPRCLAKAMDTAYSRTMVQLHVNRAIMFTSLTVLCADIITETSRLKESEKRSSVSATGTFC